MSDGRKFEVLRISVNRTCNVSCLFCSDGNGTDTQALEFTALRELILRLRNFLPLKEAHITGGEPTLHRDLPRLISGLRSAGFTTVKLTTNGQRRMDWNLLRGCGLTHLNFSLPSVKDELYEYITGGRGRRGRVLNQLEAARSAGLKLKLNMVVMRGVNDTEVSSMLAFAVSEKTPLRYLELMRMGKFFDPAVHGKYFVGEDEILQRLAVNFRFSERQREASDTAKYYTLDDGYRFGFISNTSHPFCSDCNRLRLDSTGKISGCLSSDNLHTLQGKSEEQFALTLQAALADKKNIFTGNAVTMRYSGG